MANNLTADSLFDRVRAHSREFLRGLPDRPVAPREGFAAVRSRFGMPLQDRGVAAETVIDELVSAADPGLMASAGPRFFGFVIGGSVPAAVAADWLTSTWDQNAGLAATSPAAAAAEDVAAEWILDLLRLPKSAGVGFVSGGQMANFTCLAAARHAVLARAGWDVEERGLQGAPQVRVIVGEEVHVTVPVALRFLGLGAGGMIRVAADAQGRMRPDALRDALAQGDAAAPTIVCVQAGNVNTGAFDAFPEIVAAAHARGAWVHVDGAFGLWAAAAPARRALLEGVANADSWAVDAHKWLNVPYDCGLAIVADRNQQRASMSSRAAYLVHGDGAERDPFEFVPEFSRRARGFTVYAAIRSLGRDGIAELVERDCAVASLIASEVAKVPGARVLNDVVLNQVLLRFEPRAGDARGADDFTAAVIRRVQEQGEIWLGGSRWKDQQVMRVSVSGWSTSLADAERSAAAIAAAVAAENLSSQGVALA